MDWASRELRQVSDRPTGTLTNGFGNIHGALCRIGVLQNAAGDPTALGSLSTVLFGRSYEQRTQRTLLFTFHHFVDMLEYIIDKELKALAGFEWRFDQLDTLFGMVREMVTGQTELKAQEEGELLASLWKNILGSRAEKDYVRRLYKKNHDLLLDVRRQTLGNRRVLVQHGSELLTVKVNLETLRDALVKPLVRSNDSSTLTIAEQVLGIDSYTRPLRAARERQRDIVYAVLSGHAPPQVPEIGGPVITARRAPRDD
ncbi:MAG: hypothetical protein M1815_004506 [Lichina confinis]|nr:MAG: hypothetical protein M1815_004506 [Lichina confinis]